MECRIVEHIQRAEWDRVAPHPLQSYAWGEARTILGTKVVRFGLFDGNVLSQVFQMTIHKVPLIPLYVGYIPRSVFPNTAVIEAIRSYAHTNRIAFVKFEPDVLYDELPTELPASLRVSTHPLFALWTQVIPLSKSYDETLQRFEKDTRYSIRKSKEDGTQIISGSDEKLFNDFVKLYFETAARKKYHGHSVAFHREVWQSLTSDGHSRIFVAYKGEVALAACHVFLFNKKIYYVYAGSNGKAEARYAPTALIAELVRFGAEHGYEAIDLWGSLAPEELANSTNPWVGFSKFKHTFGTRFVHFAPSYDLVISKSAYVVYGLLHLLRNKLTFRGK